MTKTKKCSFFQKSVFSFFALLFFCGVDSAFSTDSWTLAAQKFSLTQKTSSTSVEMVCTAMPSLILEQFAENLERMPRGRENLDRSLYDLQKERLSLFLQLSKEVKTRDSILLQNYSAKRLSSKLKESDKKIQEIQQKILDNLKKAEDEHNKYAPDIKRDERREQLLSEGKIVDVDKEDNKFLTLFKSFSSDDAPAVENVVLYQNDPSKLFEANQQAVSGGYDSYAFEKACVDSNINGLITGTITLYGSFVSCSVEIYQFPGARIIGRATDVGSMDDLKSLASSISMQITPRIADSMPVKLSVKVEPPEAMANAVVTIDDVIYKDFSNPILIHSGIHSLYFTSEGYDSVSASYAFTGSRFFEVKAEMKKHLNGSVNLRFKKVYPGDIYANCIFSGHINEESPYSSIKINNKTVLGHFIAEDGTSADFIIPVKYLSEGAYLSVNAKAFDRSAYIEKRRKWMYGSYSALIVSLIPTFYAYGNSYAAATAYNNNSGVSYDEANRWQTASYVCSGVSVAAGAFFVYELVRYLKAANTVLPATAAPVSKKEMLRIENNKIESEEKQ